MLDETIIPRASLPYKYRNELHAFELVPLSYYVASINIESVYDELKPNSDEEYEANNVTVLTDTFATHDVDVLPLMTSNIQRNASLRQKVDKLPLRVIVGNPPYSAGQSSGNDNNQNEHYPELESRLEETYVQRAGKITLKNSLYDSYIKAFRWASDKIGESGIVAFVSNAGWLDSAAANGMRKCLADEFNSIYVYHLKGNARTSGEQRRKEKDNVFGVGTRTPIAITILVKNPASSEHGVIKFGCVDDYLTREQKLAQLEHMRSISGVAFTEITPDEHGDWLNLRRDDFTKFLPVKADINDSNCIFNLISNGIKTNRDVWSFNSSKRTIEDSFTRCISFYNSQVEEAIRLGDKFEINFDPTKMKWDRPQKAHVLKFKKYSECNPDFIVTSVYRPFVKQYLYNDGAWLNCSYQMPKLFPYNGAENLAIGICGVGSKEFSCLISDCISDVQTNFNEQCLPRYVYTEAQNSGVIGEFASAQADEHGYVREDAINPEAVDHFRAAYSAEGESIDADAVFYYIYGLLHSKDYRETYANNFVKELPRIPRVETYADFKAFEQAGRKLAELHVNYESVTPYNGCTIEKADNVHYRVEKLAYGKINGKTGNAAKDKTCIVYNETLTIKNIPLEAQEYIVNKKSGLDWIVERCCVKQDKETGIVNDYNDYATEAGDEKYIFNLILRVITVSLETVKIVNSLPKLNIHPLDK